VGVNTAIYSPSGASAGIGFAVPVDTVNRVVPELIATGRYTRAVLGIAMDETINSALAARHKVEGVYVLRLAPQGPAEKAGLRPARVADDGSITPGDVIVAVNDKPVPSVARLIARLDDFSPGDKVRVMVLRDERRVVVEAVLAPDKSR
jgi:S1-C subfamily serine protease